MCFTIYFIKIDKANTKEAEATIEREKKVAISKRTSIVTCSPSDAIQTSSGNVIPTSKIPEMNLQKRGGKK